MTSTAVPGPRGPARRAPALVATPARALTITVLSGAAISLQAYVNGQLGGRIDSAWVAAAINVDNEEVFEDEEEPEDWDDEPHGRSWLQRQQLISI